jgi:hypothetical protein
VRRNRWVYDQKQQRAERDEGVENPAQSKRETDQKQSIQAKHRGASAALHGIRIIHLENEALRKNSLIRLVTKLAKRLGHEAGRGNGASDPKLHQRRMLWINLKCAVFDIKNAGGNMVGLVECKSIEPGGDGGSKDANPDEQQNQPDERGKSDGLPPLGRLRSKRGRGARKDPPRNESDLVRMEFVSGVYNGLRLPAIVSSAKAEFGQLAAGGAGWYSSGDHRGRNGFDGNCSGSKACRVPPTRNMVEQHNWQLTVGTRSLT